MGGGDWVLLAMKKKATMDHKLDAEVGAGGAILLTKAQGYLFASGVSYIGGFPLPSPPSRRSI